MCLGVSGAGAFQGLGIEGFAHKGAGLGFRASGHKGLGLPGPNTAPARRP